MDLGLDVEVIGNFEVVLDRVQHFVDLSWRRKQSDFLQTIEHVLFGFMLPGALRFHRTAVLLLRGRFDGRIWVENQDYTIVRFNGVYTPVSGINGYNLHFDSWRVNMQPGLWLPAACKFKR